MLALDYLRHVNSVTNIVFVVIGSLNFARRFVICRLWICWLRVVFLFFLFSLFDQSYFYSILFIFYLYFYRNACCTLVFVLKILYVWCTDTVTEEKVTSTVFQSKEKASLKTRVRWLEHTDWNLRIKLDLQVTILLNPT